MSEENFALINFIMQFSRRSVSQGREMIIRLLRLRESVLQCQLKQKPGMEERGEKLLDMEKISSEETSKYMDIQVIQLIRLYKSNSETKNHIWIDQLKKHTRLYPVDHNS